MAASKSKSQAKPGKSAKPQAAAAKTPAKALAKGRKGSK